MRKSFALILEQKRDVANLGSRFEQPQAKPAAVHGFGVLSALQRVARPAISKPPFFRSW
jgi:hypothetical protein